MFLINNLHAAQALACFLCSPPVVTGALIRVLAGKVTHPGLFFSQHTCSPLIYTLSFF